MIPLAHGGTAGLVSEIAIGLLLAGGLAAVWLRERRRRRRGGGRPEARMRE